MDTKATRVEAVLTKGAIMMHAAVIAAVGGALIWLGQYVFFTRQEAEVLAQYVKATAEQVRETSLALRAIQEEQTRVAIAVGGLQDRQSLVADIPHDVKEELQALRLERPK